MFKHFRYALLLVICTGYLPNTTPVFAAGCDTSGASISLNLRAPKSGSYSTWLRYRKITAGVSQASIEIGGQCKQLKLDSSTAGTWHWTNKSPANTTVLFDLTNAQPTIIKLTGIDEIQLDRVIVLRLGESCADNSSTPTGLGDNCTTAPTSAGISAVPGSSTIKPIELSGRHAALPRPTIDQGTVVQINYYLDGVLVSSTNQSDSGYVDSTRFGNGPHDLTTELVSVDGKLQQSSLKVTVKNDQSLFAPISRFASRYRWPLIYIFFGFLSFVIAVLLYLYAIKRRRRTHFPASSISEGGLPLAHGQLRHEMVTYIGGLSIVLFVISGLVLGNASAALWRNYSADVEAESGVLTAYQTLKLVVVRDATASGGSFISFALKTAIQTLPATPTPLASVQPGTTPKPTPPQTRAPSTMPTMPGMNSNHPVAEADFLPSGTSSGQLLIDGGQPIPPLSGDGTGDFRVVCRYTHMNYDDPIVYPGQTGPSHLHTYFGNTAANAFSSYSSLRSSGNSTCDGGIANRSAYWAPALLNAATKPVPIDYGYIYYKSGYRSVAPSSINKVPNGLKMIAGVGASTTAQSSEIVSWSCESSPGVDQQSIPLNCGQNTYIIYTITFPQCWNGRDLDSADHKSHMAYPTYGVGCPSSHSVAIPVISLHIRYKQTSATTAGWRLSSDGYTVSSSQPGGLSAHADFMEAWEATIRDAFTSNCIQAARDCGVRDLGDGRVLHMLPIP